MPEFSVQLMVARQHPCYADHFPGQPVVPGALLLEWVSQYLIQHYPHLRVVGITSFKFFQPVFPEDLLKIIFQLSDDATFVRVECLRLSAIAEPKLFAKGKISLGLKDDSTVIA